METKFRIVTKKPNTLNEILNAFQKACDAKDIEEIFRHLDYYSENGFGGYTSIIVDYQFNMDLGRPNIYKAYLRFMSLCIFYHREGHRDAAWYYFSRAEYFKGIYDAWDEVKKTNEIIKFLGNEKSNDKKELNALDKIVSKALKEKLLTQKKNIQSAWVDKSSFTEVVNADVHEILSKHKKSRSRPTTDGSVKRLIYRLLREDYELNTLFKESLK